MPTPSMEDYLEKIYQISQKKGYARVSDVAQALGLQLPSVSRMIQKMGDKDLVNYEKYGGIVLTDKGHELGQFLHDRHQVLEVFLQLLGVEDEEVIYRDVEGIEHHISTETLHQIMKFIRFSKQHPEWQEAYQRFLDSEKDQDDEEADQD
ncbi:MAG: hypothetical protein BAA01_07225 [Bacillus thermozeamaize]|uniref:Manganese transport regulator n=1 Tax=Bacillus thermozeamaize TaxID=230954 RepID=A0A1Y3PTQ0_9BACI|nr:MAG: hypothetical protein BAA01_07225 [Bacillus thermozeamaize]